MKNGKGLYVDSDGEFYKGEWDKDEPSGYGIFKSLNPPVHYKGEWFQGLKNGKGVEEYSDGSQYTGEFINGKKSGEGKI